MTAAPPLPNIGRLPDGRFVTSSRRLAACCAREHSQIKDAVRKARGARPDLEAEFIPTTFRSRNGRTYDAWYLGPRALVATFRFLDNMPGRFDKGRTLAEYWSLFVQVGAATWDDLGMMPKVRPEPEREPPVPWPVWAITEGQLVNAVWDELLAGEGA